MIRLSGFSVRDKDNPEGDIEIVFTGLRPGEKLYFLPLVEYIFETFSLIY
jgi:FlaA1/EpsC-like NDP-sugar epimerase